MSVARAVSDRQAHERAAPGRVYRSSRLPGPAYDRLRLRILGPVRCARNTRPSRSLTDHPHVAAMLACVAVHGMLPADVLLRSILGSEVDDVDLETLMLALKGLLGPGWVEHSGGSLRLGTAVHCDLIELRQDFRDARYEAVCRRDSGGFLEGVEFPASSASARWIEETRRHVEWLRTEARARQRLLRIMATLGDAVFVHTASGDLLLAQEQQGGVRAEPTASLTARISELCQQADTDAVHCADLEDEGRSLRISITRMHASDPADAACLVGLRRVGHSWPSSGRLARVAGLTVRESRVAVLLAEGRPNSAIAEALFISPHTAKRHTENILAKLGVKSRAAVAAHLLRLQTATGSGMDKDVCPPAAPI